MFGNNIWYKNMTFRSDIILFLMVTRLKNTLDCNFLFQTIMRLCVFALIN